MQPQKFLANYKCACAQQPPQCTCPRKSASCVYFMDNINDIASALSEVMNICGIHQCKTKAAIEVVVYAFLHYDEIRHRVDAVPHKRLCKEDLIHELGRKCLMSRMEAQLTYSIIKRAFKAFYHGSYQGGIKNRAMEAEALHSQECLWVHAAKRTAQIFASYEGMFYTAQKTYESQIRCVYKRLYDRLQQRVYPLQTYSDCACKECSKQETKRESTKQSNACNLVFYKSATAIQPAFATPSTASDSSTSDNTCPFVTKGEVELPVATICTPPPKNPDLNLPRCFKCNCPRLICDCDVDRDTGVLSAECSQGPFTCRWIRDDSKTKRSDPCITIPEDHQCPVDCDAASQLTCDSDCECDCEDLCECAIEDGSSGYDDEIESVDEEFEAKIEEEDVEEQQDEDGDTLTGLSNFDIRQRVPTVQFDGCRVNVRYYLVEETSVSEHPVSSIALVEEHKQRLSINSVVSQQKSETKPQTEIKSKTAAKPQKRQSATKVQRLSATKMQSETKRPSSTKMQSETKRPSETKLQNAKPAPPVVPPRTAKKQQPIATPTGITQVNQKKANDTIDDILGSLI